MELQSLEGEFYFALQILKTCYCYLVIELICQSFIHFFETSISLSRQRELLILFPLNVQSLILYFWYFTSYFNQVSINRRLLKLSCLIYAVANFLDTNNAVN